MGLEHIATVWECSRQSGSSLVVLLAIASYSDHNGEWRIDQPTLQRKARLSRRRVQKLLEELVASGELAVLSHRGRGRVCTYRLQVGEKALPSAHFAPSHEVSSNPDSAAKGAAECAFPAGKGVAESAFSAAKGAAECAFSAPPSPSFPPDPHNSPYPPKKEADMESFALALPPLSGPQGATIRPKLLLEEAGIPLPSSAQISLWLRTLGGIEPLLALLRRLIHAGLASKKNPAAYVHRVVMERAARPESPRAFKTRNPVLMAGADEVRRQQALRIIARARGER